jgi:1-acyl-sn-glycerol-3-phosphate acyltransferase
VSEAPKTEPGHGEAELLETESQDSADEERRPATEGKPAVRLTFGTRVVQLILGVLVLLFLNLPYIRKATGVQRRRRGETRRLYVCNHVSLLDTPLMASILWTHGHRPVLVLGDAAVWSRNWFTRAVSARVGFLVQRGRLSRHRIEELQSFGRCAREFELVVFPEGTRGSGHRVGRCQPGIYYIARAAQVPIVPVFLEDMHLISTKSSRFRVFRGLRKLKIHFGPEIPPAEYLGLDRPDLVQLVRDRIQALHPIQD